MIVVRCLLLIAALIAGCSEPPGHSKITLVDTNVVVDLNLSQALAPKTKISQDSLFIFYIRFPNGEPGPADMSRDPQAVRIIIQPLGPQMRTRTEGAVEESLPNEPEASSERPWLDSTTAERIRVYRYKFRDRTSRELRVFSAVDGSLVGTQIGAAGDYVNTGSRRYKRKLEVTYLYSIKLDVSPAEIDKFVVSYLDANITVQEIEK